MRIRVLALVGVVAAGTAIAGSTASAGSPVTFSITVNPVSVEVGQPYQVSASGTGLECEQIDQQPPTDEVQALESDVTLTIALQPGGTAQSLGTLPASGLPDGVAGPVTFTAPTTPGTYQIEGTYFVDCRERELTDTATLIVTAATTTTTTTIAPTTSTTIAEQVAPTTVLATTTTTTVAPATLPATGRSTDGLVWLALVTLLLGGGFVTVAARRR